jgi:hypothetical protein
VPRRGGSGRAHQTPIRYLQPGSGKARTGYLWVSDIPRGSVFFHWHPGRDASGLDALFAREPVDNDTLAGPQIDELVAIIQWPCLEACLTDGNHPSSRHESLRSRQPHPRELKKSPQRKGRRQNRLTSSHSSA